MRRIIVRRRAQSRDLPAAWSVSKRTLMRIFRTHETELRPADAKTFVGAARTKLLASSDDPGASVHVYRVEFADGARTNWHTHSGPQWLLIVEGRVRVQRSGEAPLDLAAGDAVVIAA